MTTTLSLRGSEATEAVPKGSTGLPRHSVPRNDLLQPTVIFSGLGHPAWNMAVDEALLVSAHQKGSPGLIVRCYGWDRPSASMGYFQKWKSAEQTLATEASSWNIVRRPTGGGLVRHLTDWTYSLVYPAAFWNTRCASEYGVIHGLLKQALVAGLGWTDVEELPKHSAYSGKIQHCFTQPSAFDLMRQGKKIAGAAQRRSKGWLLHQGSLELGEVPDSWPMAFLRTLEEKIGLTICTRELTSQETGLAKTLYTDRYANSSWNQKF